MAVFRIEKTRDYTVMSNHHLRNVELSLKSKGLLSMMLSEPFPQKRTQNKRKKPNKNAEIKSAAIRRRKRQVQPQSVQANASQGQNGGGWCCRRLRDKQTHRPVLQPLWGSA